MLQCLVFKRLLGVCYIVLEVRDIVEEVDPGVEALVNIVVVVVQLGSDLKLEGILVAICLRESLLWLHISIIT